MLGLVLSFSTLSGCGNNTATDTEVSTEAEESDTLYGEVSSVSDDSITIEVGTYSSDDGTLTLSGEAISGDESFGFDKAGRSCKSKVIYRKIVIKSKVYKTR